jgi:hypothetical protein
MFFCFTVGKPMFIFVVYTSRVIANVFDAPKELVKERLPSEPVPCVVANFAGGEVVCPAAEAGRGRFSFMLEAEFSHCTRQETYKKSLQESCMKPACCLCRAGLPVRWLQLAQHKAGELFSLTAQHTRLTDSSSSNHRFLPSEYCCRLLFF